MHTSPIFFNNQAAFRAWLEANHLIETELIVGFYKAKSGKESMTWSQSVDEALCFGWIDAVRMSIDHERYQIRFTRRKSDSIWSVVNCKKVEDLTERGLMFPAGLASFALRKAHKSGIYSHEIAEIHFRADFEQQFKAHPQAWEYFQTLAPSYKKPSINWVISAKQEATKLKRLQALIADSARWTNQWKDNKYAKK